MMKKINNNGILYKKSVLLLKNTNSERNNNTTYLSHLNNNINIIKNNEPHKLSQFKDDLNNTQLQSYLFNLGKTLYNNNNFKIEKKQKFKDKTSLYMTSHPDIKCRYNKNNLRILKELFPNLSELNIYSNFPLYPFNNKQKIYNNNIIRKIHKKYNIKKKIYNHYYKKSILNPDKPSILPIEIYNSDCNEEKNKSNDKNLNLNNLFIRHWKFIRNKKERNNLSKNKIQNYFEENIPLKITKINLSNSNKANKVNKNNQDSFFNKNSFIDIFKNKEISKYFNNRRPFPDIINKNENNYKSVKISKNKSFMNEKNNFLNYNSEKIINNNNYSFSQQINKIQSISSRNKNKSYMDLNREKYEGKIRDTNDID